MLGWPEIIGILIVVLVLFGAKKVPELMRGLGSGIKEFKKASREVQEELQSAIDDSPPPPSSRPLPKPSPDPGAPHDNPPSSPEPHA